MVLDLNIYAINRPYVQKWHRDNPHIGVSDVISILSCATHCPCAALAFYIAEDIGYNEGLVKLIDMFIKFYDYKAILGQSEGSPYRSIDR